MLKEIHDRFENTRQEHRKIGYKTFNWYIPYYNLFKGRDTSIFKVPVKAIYNENNVVEFINICANLYNTATSQYMPLLKKQLLLATQLIALLEKEYHLENE